MVIDQTQIPEEIRDDISIILNQMDFKKISDVMDYMEWEWVGIGVPTQNDLWLKSKNLLEECFLSILVKNENEIFMRTGGLCVRCVKYDDVFKFECSFEIDQSDNYD